jgi:hypothetical protein
LARHGDRPAVAKHLQDLVTTKSLCKSKQSASVRDVGQNGKTKSATLKLADSCHK